MDYSLAHGVFFSEPNFDPSNKWALFSGGEMVSILTTTGLRFGADLAIGIAGVATLPKARGHGLAQRLVSEACAAAETQGIREAILFAHRTELYEKCGFSVVDELLQGPIHSLGISDQPEDVSWPEVERLYDHWSQSQPRRLQRDAAAWARWKYNLKSVESLGKGYFCTEGDLVREAVLVGKYDAWPVIPGSEWYGLKSLSEAIGVPGDLKPAQLYLMGRNCPSAPQMFMTDQF